MYWTVGFECVECGAEDELQHSGESLSAQASIRALKYQDMITTDQEGRPSCNECDGILTVWWSGVDSFSGREDY